MKTQRIHLEATSTGMTFEAMFPVDDLGMSLDGHTLAEHLSQISLNEIEISAYLNKACSDGWTRSFHYGETIYFLPIRPKDVQTSPDIRVWWFNTKSVFVRIGDSGITTEISATIHINPKTGKVKGFFFSGKDQVFLSGLTFEIVYDEHRVLK
jgi:hypothetical protein